MAARTDEIRVKSEQIELATFYIGKSLFGMDILKVQEINKNMERTKVPQAPDYVMGIINLRGRIVTIIDLGGKLGSSRDHRPETGRNVIVESHDEYIGLFVDQIADVVSVDSDKILPPPSNIRGAQGRFFDGVIKAEQGLIAILNVDEVLKVEDH
jgi:purine-binding chemotaxis protein CheW